MPPLDMYSSVHWVTTGSQNYFQIERAYYENLERPYNDCFKNVSEFKLNKTLIDYILRSERIYSRRDCYYLCSHLAILEKSGCGCMSRLGLIEKDCIQQWFELSSNLSSTKICVRDFLNEFKKQDPYEMCSQYCPLECDSISYTVIPYSEQFTSTGLIGNLSKSENGLEKFTTYEQVKKSYIAILVYYKNLKYTLISQEPKTRLFTYISSIGGTFGLFLGISFLSFLEIFEIFFEIIYILMDKSISSI